VDGNEVAPDFNTQEEAIVRLAAANARRKVARAERHLALCLEPEHTTLCELYRVQAVLSTQQVTEAEDGIGNLRDTIQTGGFQLVNVTPRSRPSGTPQKRKLSHC
jgi:hypothetical protein